MYKVPLVLFAFAFAPHCFAQGNFTVFDPPNSSSTHPQSINDHGDIAGFFQDVTENNSFRGFVRDRQGNITVFDPPNSDYTIALSINDYGEVAGVFEDASENNISRGFVRDREGNITILDPPNSSATFAVSINDSGVIAGTFSDASESNISRGFVRDREGNISIFDAPNAADGTFVSFSLLINSPSGVQDINARGDIAGSLVTQAGNEVTGFVRDPQGDFTVFNAPSPFPVTYVQGINDSGDIAGFFNGATGSRIGFLRLSNGDFQIFANPSSSRDIYVQGINASGDVAGWFFDAVKGGPEHGYVRNRNGNFTVLNAPNASGTYAQSINAVGDVTGYFRSSSTESERGFVFNLQ